MVLAYPHPIILSVYMVLDLKLADSELELRKHQEKFMDLVAQLVFVLPVTSIVSQVI